ncbi:RING/U-box superfamily protein [Prunus dulcis]|uniref:RING/U-box superfamily protein n=1 Tax=Prunus dulcis TaxID=3755 RepID=A0A4Y1RNU0_PRUDU|nr:RING/U-box superfamily protein [Prunus dulcis]
MSNQPFIDFKVCLVDEGLLDNALFGLDYLSIEFWFADASIANFLKTCKKTTPFKSSEEDSLRIERGIYPFLNSFTTTLEECLLSSGTFPTTLNLIFEFKKMLVQIVMVISNPVIQSPNPAARAGTGENGSFLYPVENMFIDGMPFASNWNPALRSYGYSNLNHNVDVPHYQPDASGPSHDPFQHPLGAGTFGTVGGNYAHHAPSSSYDRRAFHGVEGGFVDLTMSNGRGPHKRKSPGIPSVSERGSTSRYYSAGSSSSELPRSSELQQEKVNMDTPYMPWITSMLDMVGGSLQLLFGCVGLENFDLGSNQLVFLSDKRDYSGLILNLVLKVFYLENLELSVFIYSDLIGKLIEL